MTVEVKVLLGEKAFSFGRFQDWVNWSPGIWVAHELDGMSQGVLRALSIDQKGRVCTTGKEFMRARDDGSFPIDVYRIEVPDDYSALPTALAPQGETK